MDRGKVLDCLVTHVVILGGVLEWNIKDCCLDGLVVQLVGC